MRLDYFPNVAHELGDMSLAGGQAHVDISAQPMGFEIAPDPSLSPILSLTCWRPVMTISVEDLAAQALVQPEKDRTKLVDRPIASFETLSPSEAAWLTLAVRRRADVRAGKVAMVPLQDAIARVRARIA